ncbi:hypothetical protein FJ208_01075, partial [Candidatus Gribaldobacteria bacterium]|nr:hypothetical protein [Candidatus Gribaldobacteria bacterium]
DPDSAKQAMEQCFKDGWPNLTAEIALALKDFASAKQAMEQCFEEKRLDLAAKIAVTLAETDPGSAKQTMEQCFEKGWQGSAAEIATALAETDPGSAKQAMKQCLKEGEIYPAAQIAVALAETDPGSAKQAMEQCFKEKRLDLAAKIAVTLAETDPDSAEQAMEQCFKEKRLDLAAQIAVTLAENFTLKPQAERLQEISQKTGANDYGLSILAKLLEEDQNLNKFNQEYLPRYLQIKNIALKVNDAIDETKKWQDPVSFFIKNNLDIVNLMYLNSNLASQLFKNNLPRGLSFTQSYLEVFRPGLNNQEMFANLKNYLNNAPKNFNGYNLSDLLEIASAYQNLNQQETFFQVINNEKLTQNFAELKSELNKQLLTKISRQLGLKIEITEQEISSWQIKYLANLITNQEMIKKQGNEDVLQIYNAVLESAFKNNFKQLITDPNQNNEIGQQIAYHNQKVAEEFKKHQINWDNWLNFQEKGRMTISIAKKQNKEALFSQFTDRLKSFQENLKKEQESLSKSLEKDLIALNQKKKEFDPAKINLQDPNWLKDILPTYAKNLDYLQKNNPNFKLSSAIEESFGHLVEAIQALIQRQEQEQTLQKEFIVKLWDRDPRKDMFQGNHTHCCIAVGVKETPPGGGIATLYPQTIFQYLIDQGLQVAEVIDPDTREPIAQTWLFVTLTEKGEPVLVTDNFEVNNRYPVGNNVNQNIREAMFQFLNRYAQVCNIKRVVLGAVKTNDVATDDLKTISLPPIEKLGGYLGSSYYLETLEKKQVFDIKKEIKTTAERAKSYQIILLNKASDNDFAEILQVEELSFPPEMQSNMEDLKISLGNKKGVQIIAKNEKGNIIAYLSSLPLPDTWKELKDYDQQLKKEIDVLYIESIAIVPQDRNLSLLLKILDKTK